VIVKEIEELKRTGIRKIAKIMFHPQDFNYYSGV